MMGTTRNKKRTVANSMSRYNNNNNNNNNNNGAAGGFNIPNGNGCSFFEEYDRLGTEYVLNEGIYTLDDLKDLDLLVNMNDEEISKISKNEMSFKNKKIFKLLIDFK